ncbi:MAG TPA: BON domain-containing protein [Thermoleophilaceae bacterium]|nr:BON domain-containing protein [Thermoleophilaceae bacterium]
MKSASLVLGAALGAAAAWFLDPNDGARRRNVVRDQALKYVRKGGAEAERRMRYAAGQAKGVAHEAAPIGDRPSAEERLNDPALARKVETEIFRAADVPKGDVSVNVEDGVAYLRGEVADRDTIRRLGEEAAKVDGVRGVENLLHTPGTPAPPKQEGVVSGD